MNFLIVLAWSLKVEELFRIGLLESPLVAGAQLVDCPVWSLTNKELFLNGLENKEVLQI